ncbi:MAG: hypothetical protein JWL99_5647, partial [Streptomyces oryziradicis]|nr:hypothetical protein [Actinacidiphila oryziradicis]
MITRINAKTGKETIRSIRVLPPGGDQTLQTETPRERESAPPVEPGPVRTRETASAGYREALAAFQATKPDSPAKPEGCNLTSTPAPPQTHGWGGCLRSPQLNAPASVWRRGKTDATAWC